MPDYDGEIRLKLKVTPDGVKDAAKQLSKQLESSMSTTGVDKMDAKLMKLTNTMQKLRFKANGIMEEMQKLESTKIELSAYKDAQKQLDGLNKQLDKTADKVDKARAMFDEEREALSQYIEGKRRELKEVSDLYENSLYGVNANGTKYMKRDPRSDEWGRQKEELSREIAAMEEKLNAMNLEDSKTYQSLVYDLNKLQETREQVLSEIARLEESGEAFKSGTETEKYQKLAEQLELVNNEMRIAQEQMDAFTTTEEGATASTEELTSTVDGLKQKAKGAYQTLQKPLPRTSFLHERNLGKTIKTLLAWGLGIRSVITLVQKLRQTAKESLKVMASYDSVLNAKISNILTSIKQIKADIGTMIEPLVQALAPVVNNLLQKLHTVIIEFAKFFAALTGQDYISTATVKNVDYADSLDDIAKSADNANRALGAYDQLNVISKEADATDDAKSTLALTKETVEYSKQALDPNDWSVRLGTKLREIFSWVWDKLKAIKDWLSQQEWAQEITDNLKELLSDPETFLVTIGATLLVSKLASKIASGVSSGITDGISLATAGKITIAAVVAVTGYKFGNYLYNNVESVQQAADDFMEFLFGKLPKDPTNPQDYEKNDTGYIGEVVETFMSWLQNPKNTLTETVETLKQAGIDMLKAADEDMKNNSAVSINGGLLGSLGEDIKFFAKNLVTPVTEVFGKGIGDWFNNSIETNKYLNALTGDSNPEAEAERLENEAKFANWVTENGKYGPIGSVLNVVKKSLLKLVDLTEDDTEERWYNYSHEWHGGVSGHSATSATTALENLGRPGSPAYVLDLYYGIKLKEDEKTRKEEEEKLKAEQEEKRRKAAETLKNLWSNLKTTMNLNFEQKWDTTPEEALQQAKDKISQAWNSPKNVVKNALTSMQTNFKSWFSDALGLKGWGLTKEETDSYTNSFGKVNEEVKKQWKAKTNPIKSGFAEIGQLYQLSFSDIFKASGGGLTSAQIIENKAKLTAVSTKLKELWNAKDNPVKTAFDSLGASFKKFWNGVFGIKDTNADIEAAKKSGKALTDSVISGANDAMNKDTTFKETMANWFSRSLSTNISVSTSSVTSSSGDNRLSSILTNGLTGVLKIKAIPKLARGAVIPANREFLAMLGDQTSGTNIEAPLDTIVNAMKLALESSGRGAQTINLNVGGKQIAQVVWDETEKRYKQVGQTRFA